MEKQLEYFRLDSEKNLVPATDWEMPESMEQWEKKYRVGRTQIDDKTLVSTLFIPLNCGTEEDPVFFHTAVMQVGKGFEIVHRYVTYQAAKLGHDSVVEGLRSKQEDHD